MEFLPPIALPTTVMAAIFAFLLLFYVLWVSKCGRKNKPVAPEAAGAWPLIGHLHLVRGPQLPAITLGTMADKYGPIFTIRLGVHRALVVSSWEIAKECFTTNDRVFCNRPKSMAVELMGYNYAMFGFGPYGQFWREMRKIITLKLLSRHRIAMLNHVYESEVKASMKDTYELWVRNRRASDDHVMVEMKKWFGDMTLNLIRRIVGRETNTASWEGDWCRKKMKEFFELMGTFTVSDALPFLRWLDIGGYEKAMRKTAKELDLLLQGWLEEHYKQKRVSGEVKSEQDFMDDMLSILDDAAVDHDQAIYDADTITKATCLNLLLAGSGTISVTLTWALSLLLNNRHALKKAQEELDTHVGRERQVNESDLKNLVYLQAIIKETMRLSPAALLSPPRESMKDCTLAGYHVPAGSRLFINFWKLHRDPRIWSDHPLEFSPERFLTTHREVDVHGLHFELIPFGSGRRVCPGIYFSLQVMQLVLASLLQGFEVATPLDELIDMSVSFGSSNPKATPLEVLLTPRLPSLLYG
ncbi:hypothetical protein F0562_027978 [Nyssa sinensis]|uniref:Cytochrome P450 n=1 Tax=Nyssa sinensis TaxID=561372 RepID=A0A5J5B822_9ASTE|nr:hypothetical protein F0562_027978 [Nyssa sinensis]